MLIKNIFVIIVFIGIIFITINITKLNNKCEPKVIYRYIPRTFDEKMMIQ